MLTPTAISTLYTSLLGIINNNNTNINMENRETYFSAFELGTIGELNRYLESEDEEIQCLWFYPFIDTIIYQHCEGYHENGLPKFGMYAIYDPSACGMKKLYELCPDTAVNVRQLSPKRCAREFLTKNINFDRYDREDTRFMNNFKYGLISSEWKQMAVPKATWGYTSASTGSYVTASTTLSSTMAYYAGTITISGGTGGTGSGSGG